MRWSLRFLVEPIGNVSLLYNLIRNWDVVSISSLLIWNPRTSMLVQRPSYSPNRLLTSQKKLPVLQSSSCKLVEDSRFLDNPTRAPAVCFDVYAASCFQKRESGSPCVPLSSLSVQNWFIISSTEIIPITCMNECQLDTEHGILALILMDRQPHEPWTRKKKIGDTSIDKLRRQGTISCYKRLGICRWFWLYHQTRYYSSTSSVSKTYIQHTPNLYFWIHWPTLSVWASISHYLYDSG